MKKTLYKIKSTENLKIAVVADFHSRRGNQHYEKIIRFLNEEIPDIILCPGDIFNNADKMSVIESHNKNGFDFLKKCRETAPVFFSVGNHEHGISPSNRALLAEVGITVLDNEFTVCNGIAIGGLSTGYCLGKKDYITHPKPDIEFINSFSLIPGFKILLCHHPEYWSKYINGKSINLTVSGHAHGGQWCLFGQGVYAPGQGLFPKYTHGVHGTENEALVISRGLTNTVHVPRFFNPCELIFIQLKRKE